LRINSFCKRISNSIKSSKTTSRKISDKETIYRQRYLDLITNQESYDRMLFRSDFIKTIRDFYIKNNFVEITTPIL